MPVIRDLRAAVESTTELAEQARLEAETLKQEFMKDERLWCALEGVLGGSKSLKLRQGFGTFSWTCPT